MASQDIDIIIQAKDMASKALNNVSSSLWGLDKNSKNASKSFWISAATIVKWLTAIWAYQITKGILNLGIELEQTQIAFTTMLGSADQATKTLDELTDFAKKTPFELTGLRTTAKQLLAFWFEADELIPTLKSLWDVASWLSVPIEQVAYAYGQVRTANQLYGTELRQFMNAGIPILQELADMYGVTASEAKKMTEDGLISFEDVEEAFKRMSWEGGAFANMMDEQSASLWGMLSNLKDSVVSLGESIGMALIPVIKELIDEYQPVIEQAAESLALWFSNKENIDSLIVWVQGLIWFFWTLGDILWFIIKTLKLMLMPFQDATNSIALLAANVYILAWRIKNELLPAILNMVTSWIQALLWFKNDAIAAFSDIKDRSIELVESMWEAITSRFDAMASAISSALRKAKDAAKEIATLWFAKTETFNGSDWTRANGWGVEAGKSYLVGEGGRAEMFTPKVPWVITPIENMPGWNNGWPVNISINVEGSGNPMETARIIKQELSKMSKAYNLWIS